MLITVFLVLVNIFSNVISDTPNKDDGVTALENWMLACIVFVFASFSGYIIILARLKMKQHRRCVVIKMAEKNNRIKEEMGRDMDLDILFLLIVIISFILFNMHYWATLWVSY